MCFGGREKTDEVGVARSRELDKVIRADEKRLAKEVKLLLLGMHLLSLVAIGGPRR
jgi:guanine nucleotide-binding protein subunit alpha